MKKIIGISFICLFIDQIIKLLIATSFNIHQGITLIPGFFTLIRVHNNGAAWSFLSGNTNFLIILSLVALVTIYIFFIRNNELKRIDMIIYGVLIGGILGNLFDRVFRGYVIDYLDFQIFNYNFPVFNFADICIVLSTLTILLLQIGGKKDENIKSNGE